MQKLYCYVDETGQDDGSKIFIVVAIVSDKDQIRIRRTLEEIEKEAKTRGRKWHKTERSRKLKFLELVVNRKVAKGETFYGCYDKPLPYFLPVLDILEKAIRLKSFHNYKAKIFVDGIDKKKASELTNALRVRKISLEHVRSRRDESEPLIRLADMWAGCLRSAFADKDKTITEFVKQAEKQHCLQNLTIQNSPLGGE
jgi:hypothetical protein